MRYFRKLNRFFLCFRLLMTHASVPENQRKSLGITETLIRLSVGIEDADDLIGDLAQALKASFE